MFPDFPDFAVVIPSRGRAGWLKTLNYIPRHLVEAGAVKVCVPPSEADQYLDHGLPRRALGIQPDYVGGIANFRQYLIDTLPHKYIVMLDDDLSFSVHRKHPRFDDETAKLEDLVWNGILCLVDKLHSGEAAFAGICSRFGSNWLAGLEQNPLWVENMRPAMAYAVNREILKFENIRFSDVMLNEDFHVALSLLEQGHRIQSYFGVTVQSKANAAGGCSEYRTEKLVHDEILKMASLHPETVKVRTAKDKVVQGHKPGIHMTVQWLKASKIGSERKALM